MAIEYKEDGVSEENVLEGEDGQEGDEVLLPVRLWIGTYNPGDEDKDIEGN